MIVLDVASLIPGRPGEIRGRILVVGIRKGLEWKVRGLCNQAISHCRPLLGFHLTISAEPTVYKKRNHEIRMIENSCVYSPFPRHLLGKSS